MKDLYQALGLPGIEPDPRRISQALTQGRCTSDLEARVRFILLDPVRKARYDWMLAHAAELASARVRLRLAPDPALTDPRPAATPRPIPPSSHASGSGLYLALALGMVGLAILALIRMDTRPATRTVVAPSPAFGMPAPATPRPASVAAEIVRREEGPSLPIPDHGWVQLEAGAAPRIPWQIDTDPGRDYALTLLDAQTQARVLTLYLHGGVPYRGQAPEGEFLFTYVSGTRWLGASEGFTGKDRPIRSDQRFRIPGSPKEGWTWGLRLHPTNYEVIDAAAPPDLPPSDN
ncbi:MAG TPA: hypothetical protein VJ623_03555 [Holophagaceae bacterium]|nr:hypothetical protein [Holophagaceae bacterium]HJW34723.1 hypothetical protein [Holophagaceae bacterium]